MTEEKKDLINPNELKKEIISPRAIDLLAGKAKEHNIGIKIEKKYSDGSSESLSVWSKENETVKKWEKIVIKN